MRRGKWENIDNTNNHGRKRERRTELIKKYLEIRRSKGKWKSRKEERMKRGKETKKGSGIRIRKSMVEEEDEER